MLPPWDQTGVPIHFHSSTISGSASWTILRTLASVFPRQSPSSLIFASINAEADSIGTARFMYTSQASTLRGVGRPGGALDAELLGVLGVQALPASELHGLGADDPSDRLTREEPLEDVEADVPARGAPRDEAAIDVVPEREPRAAAERLELPPEVVATPAVLEQPGRLGPLHDGLGDLRGRRPDRRELRLPDG